MAIFKKFFITFITLVAIVAITPSAHSYAQTQAPNIPFVTTDTQHLISNEAKYFTEGAEVKVTGSLNGNVFSDPTKRYVLFTEDRYGAADTVKAFTGHLYVDSSQPAINISIYTTSDAIESTIMDGIRQETNGGFASISGVVKKVNMPAGYFYYAFDVNNVVLKPPPAAQ